MSQDEFDRLIDQLTFEPDPKQRHKIVKRLGELRRPEAIGQLVSVYENDEDDGVRKAAGDALRIFRRMEQETLSEDEAGSSGGVSNKLLKLIRSLLVITLALTLLGNAALFVSRILPPPVTPTPTPQPEPTNRDELVKTFTARIKDARTEASGMRQAFLNLQTMGFQALQVKDNQTQCSQLPNSTVNKAALAEIDRIYYPDLADVSDYVNISAEKLSQLRVTYLTMCSTKDSQTLNKQLADQKGAADLVRRVDEVINKDLTASDTALRKAINSPIPTMTQTPFPTATDTATATLTPTALPPTETPTDMPTFTATPAPPTATVPTATPTLMQTATRTPTNTATVRGRATATRTPTRRR